MYDIINFLELEDDDLYILSTTTEYDTKIITLEKALKVHFCPHCGSRMYSRGKKIRTVKHPFLNPNGYKLILILHQRRWKCNNHACGFTENESFPLVKKYKQTTNVSDLLILSAFRNLNKTAEEIGREHNVSGHHAMNVFDKYVHMKRLPLSDIISIDEVYVEMDRYSKYAMVILDFFSGDVIDIVKNRQAKTTDPYFRAIPYEERCNVKYLITDMYNPYINYVNKYFPNAVSVVDSFHVMQWIIRKIEQFIRALIKEYKHRDYENALANNPNKPIEEINVPVSDEVYLLQSHRWVLLRNEENIEYTKEPKYNKHFGRKMDTYAIQEKFMAINKDFFLIYELKEEYVAFNSRNAGNPEQAAIEIEELIELYSDCTLNMFNEFANLLTTYKQYIINSFVLGKRIIKGEVKESRLSNGPMESFNRKIKDAKRNSRGYTNFSHFRNRIIYATRDIQTLNL